MNVGREQARQLRDQLGANVDVYKIGMDMFTLLGPQVVRDFTDSGCDVFLDLKFSDIPTVVAKAVESAAALGVKLLTVHTMGGPRMLAEAAKASRSVGQKRPLVLGVTVLTSLDRESLARVSGHDQEVQTRVVALARMAQEQGCDGVVASPQELAGIRAACGRDLLVITPGIRLGAAVSADDQARTMTPAEAAAAGADYIVVGRPITDAADPLRVTAEIRAQLRGA